MRKAKLPKEDKKLKKDLLLVEQHRQASDAVAATAAAPAAENTTVAATAPSPAWNQSRMLTAAKGVFVVGGKYFVPLPSKVATFND